MVSEISGDETIRVILAGVMLPDRTDYAFRTGMAELKALAEACSMETQAVMVQRLTRVDPAMYMGRGRLEELKTWADDMEADAVIFNNTLSPSQLANLARFLEVEILDRTGLILQIFSSRARTREAKLQVEFAQLQYMLPRLVGLRANLSRQGGTGGSMSNRGAGETKLELDRRHIEQKMAGLRRELKDIERVRETQRKKRSDSALPSVALVGYTNAGKSTLLNALLERYGLQEGAELENKKVMTADMLFATLDTTVRRISPPERPDFLLSDTVGFISDLPTQLVKAFRSTLDEAVHADLLLEVVDASDPDHEQQMEVTAQTLKDLDAGKIPVIHVMNKADTPAAGSGTRIGRDGPRRIWISARSGDGLDQLIDMIAEQLMDRAVTCELILPYAMAAAEHELRTLAKVYEVLYEEDGIHVRATMGRALYGKYGRYAAQ